MCSMKKGVSTVKVNNQKMRDKIVRIVKQYPDCADDDKLLISMVWQSEGWDDPNLYEKLKSVSSPETIRRTRAKLVEDGVVKPSEKATEARYGDFQRARFDLGY